MNTLAPDNTKKASLQQRVIMDAIMQGESVEEIAERLQTSQSSVRMQLWKLRKKLGARNNVQAALRYISGMGK